MGGAVYYLLHDMTAKALLFLIIGTMVYVTGEVVVKNMSGLIRNYPLFGRAVFCRHVRACRDPAA